MTTATTPWATNWAEHGQTLAEYALILSLIFLLAIAALLFLGGEIGTLLSSVGQQI